MADEMDKGFFTPEFRSTIRGFFSTDSIPIYQGFSAIGAVSLVFLGSWIYAISEWGWFLGIALGWIPAAILASMAGFVAYYLWFVAFPFLVVMYIALFLAVIVAFGGPKASEKAEALLSFMTAAIFGQ